MTRRSPKSCFQAEFLRKLHSRAMLESPLPFGDALTEREAS